MKKWKKITLIIIAIVLIIGLCIGAYFWYMKSPYKVDHNFSHVDVKDVHHVMFVAHPDDETIWGGAHIMDGDYLVVCITCGVKKERVFEFQKVMELTHNKYIMLGYPDKTNGERDNWDDWRDKIKKDVEDILSLKKWDSVVTHNPDGEYGHIHHKITSKIVTDVSSHDKLIYFGHYYSKKRLPEYVQTLKKIDDDAFAFKVNELIEVYKTQSFIKTKFDQMFPYENWLTYEEWMAEENEK